MDPKTSIPVHPLAQTFDKVRAEPHVVISGYVSKNSDGRLELALTSQASIKVNLADVLHHQDPADDDSPSTFYVRSTAPITIVAYKTAADLMSGCGCGGDASPSDEPTVLERQRGSAATRANAIRNARCLGAYIGCSAACSLDPYPDLCRSICANQYSRCTTPIWTSL